MKIFESFFYSFLLIVIFLIEIFINTLINNDILKFYPFFVILIFLGSIQFRQKNVLPIFISGLFYDLFLSTYFLGIYSIIFILIVMISNFITSKVNTSLISLFFSVLICMFLYNLPQYLVYEFDYLISNLIFGTMTSYFLVLVLYRVLR